jgi:peptidoglycan/LPS O-acetylase OafA/YrhL
MSAIAYRPDIDGLRAVAVGTVVLFHAHLGLFPGGFVGVDVFFVISGYLITSIIARELDTGTFSLLSFYERRIRRIFPALMVVIAACLVVGAWRMTSRHYNDVAEAALAAIGFHSNIYFADKAGYFMPAAETLPLLHTWSLGVEEQFYVVAPLLLMALWRYRASVAPVLVTLMLIAVVVSIWGTAQDNDTAFYMPHTRAVELMIGMVLGVGLVPAVRAPWARQMLSALGLLMIAVSASVYTSATPFPGPAALLPCLGSALIIHCGGGALGTSLVGRLLSTRPTVWLGKISYSLYLWHWPIFAFAAYEWGEIPVAGRIALIVVSIALAAATYRWVEQPARTSRVVLTPPRVFAAGLSSAGVLAALAGVIVATHGWPGRLPTAAAAVEATATKRSDRGSRCAAALKGRRAPSCRLGDTAGPAQILIWGDSHAQALERQFDEVGKELGVSVVMVLGSGCPPILDSGARDGFGKPKCRKVPGHAMEALDSGTIRHVILAARWSGYTGRPADEAADRPAGSYGSSDVSLEIESAFKQSFARTVARLREAGMRVTLLGPVPELPVHLPSAMTKAMMRGREFKLDYDFSKFSKRQATILTLLAQSEALPRVDVIYPDRIICPLGKCRFVVDGMPIYRDDDHLSPLGGGLLKPSLVRSLAWLRRTSTSDAGLGAIRK